MNIEAAKKLASYRLFRPLALSSDLYEPHSTDEALAKSITKWTSNILLGGHHYDLKTLPEYIFQIQSNILNRAVYFIPVWDGDLVREIVLRSEKKTNNALNGCGCGPIKKLNYLGGILVLKRYLFRATPTFQMIHASSSEWFVEDRYHMDVFTDSIKNREKGTCHTKAKMDVLDSAKERGKYGMTFQPVFRVFHDSVCCVEIPHLSLDHNTLQQNNSFSEVLPEYYPSSNEVILNWHELAQLMGLTNTGIYALATITAIYESAYQNSSISKISLRGYYYGSDGNQYVYKFIPELINFAQPLQQDLTRKYANFSAQFFIQSPGTPIPVPMSSVPYSPDTFAQTMPPSGVIGNAVIQFLSRRVGNFGTYIGDGLFRMACSDNTQLAAGSGNWGSPENAPVGITWEEITGDSSTGSGASDNAGANEAQGTTGLTVDLIRYWQRDEYNQEVAGCRATNVSAECTECIKDSSTVDTFHDAGVAADFVDTVAGIAACAVASYYGHAWVCGLTLPSAGASAVDFWNNTFGGYDYAADLCYGLPDAESISDQRCEWRGPVPAGASGFPKEESEATIKEYLKARCREHIGITDPNDGWILKDARFEPSGTDRTEGKVYCKYCEFHNV